jgi:hypothetical protein
MIATVTTYKAASDEEAVEINRLIQG